MGLVNFINWKMMSNTVLNRKFLLLASFCTAIVGGLQGCTSFSGEITASHYQVFRGDGSPATMEQLLQSVSKADVTFLGEIHNDPVAHYLENLILTESWQPSLALSLEMFETDVQYVVDEYLAGHISEDHFIRSGRAWGNYDTDYKPMIEFIKERQGRIIAANSPRRYVNMVTRKGSDALLELPEEAKSFLPQLPYARAREPYEKKFKELMAHNMQPSSKQSLGESELSDEEQQEEQEREKKLQQTLQAQSLWDAGMAWSIAQYLEKNPNDKVLHVNGGFHTAERMGILDHLSLYNPDVSALVVTMIASDSFPSFDVEEMAGQGDFVIVTDLSVPSR